MINADVPYLSTKSLIEKPTNPFTGNEINTKQKEDGLYIADSDLWVPDKHNKNTFKIKDDEWYFVHDDIFNPENWSQEVPQ